MFLKRLKSVAGFTMQEMILSIALLGMFSSLGVLILVPVLDAWSVGTSRNESTASADYALQRMISEIAELKDDISVISATSTFFSFSDSNDNTITYALNAGQLTRNSLILARDVTNLTFAYYDLNNAAIVGPQVSPASTDIWRIAVSVSAQYGDQIKTMESQMHPRNLMRN